MSKIPSELHYTRDHEWIAVEDGIAIVGITDHAQEALGDLVYVELPEENSQVEQGGAFAVVESVKAASEVYAPLSGEVVEVNQLLSDTPEKINESPYEDGWIAKIKLSDEAELGKLMDAGAYETLLEDEA